MLKMLVVLVIVVRPHTGTLRGLRRRLFSRLVTILDPARIARGRNRRARRHRTTQITTRAYVDLWTLKKFSPAAGAIY